MKWEVVIGLETHAQLSTRSKIFSGAPTVFGASPNSQASAVDIALPGVLPVLNRGAVERAIRFGLAVGGKINRRSIFARKNYFYPDLPKGYQISQYELPVVQGGEIPIVSPTRGEIKIQLTRAHLEEDAGKSIHGEALSGVAGFAVAGYMRAGVPLVSEELDLTKVSGIDLNRAGTPLLEIVTEPELQSAEEAIAYAKKLHAILTWNDICDGNMEEGSFRCDANVSVRPMGSNKLGTRCEIKNLNSFRFMEQAIKFEVRRQIELIEDGGKVVQETRLYDPDKDETRSMRSKEDAMDYRYFPDPDLLPLSISEQWIEEVRVNMRPQQQVLFNSLVHQGVSAANATVLTSTSSVAVFHESTTSRLTKDANIDPKEAADIAANWIVVELAGALNRDGLDIRQSPVSSEQLAWLLARIKDGTISAKAAKDVFQALWKKENAAVGANTLPALQAQGTGGANAVDQMIESMGLKQISDSGEIEKIVDQVLAANVQQVTDYKSGKEKAFNSLVGQVMKASKGKANPAQVNALLKKKLGGG